MEILKPFSKMLQRSASWRMTPESDSLLGRLFSGPMSKTGIDVNAESAMRSVTVYSCTRVLSEDVAAMPAILYKDAGEGFRDRAVDDPLWEILHDMPNEEVTSIEFWQNIMWGVLLRGKGYAYKVYNGAGEIAELRYLNPDRLRELKPRNAKEKPAFEYYDDFNEKQLYSWEDLFKVHGPFGLSVISYCKECIALQLAQEQYAAAFFGNYGSPRGVIEFAGEIGEDDAAIQSWKKNFINTYAGPDNSWGVALLERGAKFTPISVTHQDSEFLESRKFQRTDICGIFRVPPHMIGELTRSTYSNIEQQSLDYVNQSLIPWLVRIQQAAYRDLLSKEQRRSMNMEFLTAGLMRGDITTRYAAYKTGRDGGWLSPNDIRRKESEPKLSAEDGGDIYTVPMNTIPSSQIGKTMAGKPGKEQKKCRITAKNSRRKAQKRAKKTRWSCAKLIFRKSRSAKKRAKTAKKAAKSLVMPPILKN